MRKQKKTTKYLQMDNCPVYYLSELNLHQPFWFDGFKFVLESQKFVKGSMRCRRSDGVVCYLRKDLCVVPEWTQATLF